MFYNVLATVLAIVLIPVWLPVAIWTALFVDPMENVPDGKEEKQNEV